MSLIQSHLVPFRSELQGLVVESTYSWFWLVDGLMEDGYRVHLANTTAIAQYNGIKYTHDATDARFLAQLLGLGILPEGYIYPPAERAVRDLYRRRLLLVRQRTMAHLSLQSLIARHSSQHLSAQQLKKLKREDLEAYFTYPASLETARVLHGQMTHTSKAIARVIEAAHYATIWNPVIQRFFQRRQNKVHKMVARKTVANNLAKACYHMLK